MKVCTKCLQPKPETAFHLVGHTKDGLDYKCKDCKVAATRDWRRDNRERYNASANVYAKANRGSGSLWAMERKREKTRKWFADNPSLRNFYNQERRIASARAKPVWANDFFISEAFALAVLRTRITGMRWSVDHCVPLQSPLVCGLHWERNLQVIPFHENIRKSNRYWPDMW